MKYPQVWTVLCRRGCRSLSAAVGVALVFRAVYHRYGILGKMFFPVRASLSSVFTHAIGAVAFEVLLLVAATLWLVFREVGGDGIDAVDKAKAFRTHRNNSIVEGGGGPEPDDFINFLTGRGLERGGDDCVGGIEPLLPTDVFVVVCAYLFPRDVTSLACVDQSGWKIFSGVDYTSSLLWRALWYRDYGDVLLKWDAGRDAIRRSLPLVGGNSIGDDGGISLRGDTDAVATALASALDGLTAPAESSGAGSRAAGNNPMRDLYFATASHYLDYVLAGRNTPNRCLLGLHGHVFDFTDFADAHPGLSDPVVAECGRDATAYFEDVRHSAGARRIASRLCVMIDRARLQLTGETMSVGGNGRIGLVAPPHQSPTSADCMISWSNTRPPPSLCTGEGRGKVILDRLLPPGPTALASSAYITLSAPLCHLREMDRGRQQAERKAAKVVASGSGRHSSPLWSRRRSTLLDHNRLGGGYERSGGGNDEDPLRFGQGAGITAVPWTQALTLEGNVRVYYDPFQRRWMGWYNAMSRSGGDLRTFYCELDGP